MASKPATKAKTTAAPKVAAEKPAKPALEATKKPTATVARTASPKTTDPKTIPKAALKNVVKTVTLNTVFEQLAKAQDMPKKQALAIATGMVTW